MNFNQLCELLTEAKWDQGIIHSAKLSQGNPFQTDITDLDSDIPEAIDRKLEQGGFPQLALPITLNTFFEDYFDDKLKITMSPRLVMAIAIVINGLIHFNISPEIIENRKKSLKKLLLKSRMASNEMSADNLLNYLLNKSKGAF